MSLHNYMITFTLYSHTHRALETQGKVLQMPLSLSSSQRKLERSWFVLVSSQAGVSSLFKDPTRMIKLACWTRVRWSTQTIILWTILMKTLTLIKAHQVLYTYEQHSETELCHPFFINMHCLYTCTVYIFWLLSSLLIYSCREHCGLKWDCKESQNTISHIPTKVGYIQCTCIHN